MMAATSIEPSTGVRTMAKKKTKSEPQGQAIRIGSRVRCTDDGVEGRIVWANATSVKIEWTDGEKVTWKREAMKSKPIEILDAEEGTTVTGASLAQQEAAVETPAIDDATPPAEV